ncbi:MAG: adenine deaminase [Bacteroidales bacterium]|nr:adenine deaminase [Bacteroidales bacterium]
MKKYSGNIVDVYKKRIYKGEITISNGKINDIIEKQVPETQYILPGLINAHVHIESSLLTPSAFATIAVQHGTVAVVSDPHEIANVLGVKGIDFMINDGNKVPLKFFFGAPSCVPATDLESSGAVLDAKIISQLLERQDIHYLSEMMNYPGVINDIQDIKEKLQAAINNKKPIDGHAPGLTGKQLEKYAKAGITTDHECVSLKEAEEKIKAGIKIQIREGSAAKNFDALFPLIDKYPNMVMLCTDDSHPEDLISGHINSIIKKGLHNGVDFFNILQTATINPKEHYNLNVGMLRKNDLADFIIIDNLINFNVQKTIIEGEEVFKFGKTAFRSAKSNELNNFNRKPVNTSDIDFPAQTDAVPVINIIDKELLTTCSFETPKLTKNSYFSDKKQDILKIVVVNRYNPKTKPAVGFIKGLGFKKGAICSSVAHDSHNLVAAGVTDKDILSAINKVIEMKGGIALAKDNIAYGLQLEIAGLMTNMNGYEVAEKYKCLEEMTKTLGSKLQSPFMTLAFMTLLPIPEIKISDKGVFDVVNQRYF